MTPISDLPLDQQILVLGFLVDKLDMIKQFSQFSYQINQVTQYRRTILNLPYEKEQQQDSECFLRGKQYQILQFCREQEKKSTLTIELADISIFDKISKQIRKSIHKNFVQVILPIPQMETTDLHRLAQMINGNALQIEGQVIINNSITITITPQIKQDIMDHRQQSQLRYQEIHKQLGSQIESTYPKEWVPQDSNFLKVQLLPADAEYERIENLFKETDPNGRVHVISRIQNLILWDNYIREERKLLKFYMEKHQQLNPEELELYAWHGTKEHPSIIYDSDREGFDTGYSKDTGYWGPACYFAEKASYSRNYSYTLQPIDDVANQGRKVFLCCLLTTGRAKLCKEDKSLRKPPGDYDSVTGVTGESTVYMLYGVGARRAYPAYEVIYE